MQEECKRYGMHKLIRTKHGAHSFKIRSSNGIDTLSHSFQYAVYLIRHQFAERGRRKSVNDNFVNLTLLIRYLYVNSIGRHPGLEALWVHFSSDH